MHKISSSAGDDVFHLATERRACTAQRQVSTTLGQKRRSAGPRGALAAAQAAPFSDSCLTQCGNATAWAAAAAACSPRGAVGGVEHHAVGLALLAHAGHHADHADVVGLLADLLRQGRQCGRGREGMSGSCRNRGSSPAAQCAHCAPCAAVFLVFGANHATAAAHVNYPDQAARTCSAKEAT